MTYSSISDKNRINNIKSYFFIFIVLYVVNNALNRNPEDPSIFSIYIYGKHYITPMLLIYGAIISPHFRAFLKTKLGISILALCVWGIVSGLINMNSLFDLRIDFMRILYLLLGALAYSLIVESNLRAKGIAILAYVFLLGVFLAYFQSAYYSISTLFSFTARMNIISSVFLTQGLVCIFFVFITEKIINGHKKFSALFIFFSLMFMALFFGRFRIDIIAGVIGFFILLIGNFNKINKAAASKSGTLFLLILKRTFFILIFLGALYLIYYSFSTFSAFYRPYSDSHRIEEFEVGLYQIWTKGNILFGSGFGAWFQGSARIEAVRELHLGFMTLWLKFGLVGLILITLSIIISAYKFFSPVNNKNIKLTTSFYLAFPSIAAWVVFVLVTKGTFQETLFGLGFALAAFRISPFKSIDSAVPKKIITFSASGKTIPTGF